MTAPAYFFAAYDERFDAAGFDCGHEAYNTWLTGHAATAARSGTAGVYVLVRQDDAGPRILGYFAIAPTAVIRADLPRSASGGSPDPVPGFLLAKLALDRSLQGDRSGRWGTQLVLDALRRIIAAAQVSGGRVIVVDADNPGLVPFYRKHDFLPTKVDPLRLYMKVSSARAAVERYDLSAN